MTMMMAEEKSTTNIKESSRASSTEGNNDNEDESSSSSSGRRQRQQQLQTRNQQNKCITKLPQHVVDMIAAGEVVQRPSAVIKELIENSLDAGSTKIIVDLEGNGCLDKITITDNGKGIHKDDLKLAATRHATSKLTSVTDFQTLDTFGFRGEALASISFVCRKLTITTRTPAATATTTTSSAAANNNNNHTNVGYKQVYQNGKPYPSESTPPKPCAKGTVGTTITIQDLFYNVPHRKQTFTKRSSDEYQHSLNVIQSYAILNGHVGFICQRKHKTKGILVDLNTCQLPAVQTFITYKQQHRELGLEQHHQGEEEQQPTQNEQYDELHIKATKQVLAHILETNLERHLSCLDCSSSSNTDDGSMVAPTPPPEEEGLNNDDKFAFKCRLFYSSPSYYCQLSSSTMSGKKKVGKGSGGASSGNTKSMSLIFVNERLIDCPSLRRSLEDAYSALNTSTSKNINKVKPILVVQIRVPGNQVDVNVHPTKRLVALMYQDELCAAISTQLRQVLLTTQNQATFQAANSIMTTAIENPYKTKLKGSSVSESNDNCAKEDGEEETVTQRDNEVALAGQKRKKYQSTAADEDDNDDSDYEEAGDKNNGCGGDRGDNDRAKKQQKSDSNSAAPTRSGVNNKPKKTPSSQKIRTSNVTPVGAIEPFLTRKKSISQTQSPSQSSDQASSSNGDVDDGVGDRGSSSRLQSPDIQHLPTCPVAALSKRSSGAADTTVGDNDSDNASGVDMSQPGAFATALRCTCGGGSQPRQQHDFVREQPVAVRPKRIVPTKCHYSSIATLRKRVQERSSESLTKKLRNAYFVGVVSHQRSLVQCQDELVLINHLEMAKELFYQLALARFGPNGANRANLCGEGDDYSSAIRIHALIAQALQFEEQLGAETMAESEETDIMPGDLLAVSDVNNSLAEQVVTGLWDHAEMLEEYFGICFRKVEKSIRNDQLGVENHENQSAPESMLAKQIVLTHLPILLDDHAPEPHGLPLFLLRLATLVDWNEERPCFQGICRELGNYYAQLPSDEDRRQSYIQHGLFPAISYLLISSERLQSSGSIVALTRLASLYKVFERC